MPPGFEWSQLDVTKSEQLEEMYTLLNENYVEDDDNMFRFDYSIPFLQARAYNGIHHTRNRAHTISALRSGHSLHRTTDRSFILACAARRVVRAAVEVTVQHEATTHRNLSRRRQARRPDHGDSSRDERMSARRYACPTPVFTPCYDRCTASWYRRLRSTFSACTRSSVPSAWLPY